MFHDHSVTGGTASGSFASSAGWGFVLRVVVQDLVDVVMMVVVVVMGAAVNLVPALFFPLEFAEVPWSTSSSGSNSGQSGTCPRDFSLPAQCMYVQSTCSLALNEFPRRPILCGEVLVLRKADDIYIVSGFVWSSSLKKLNCGEETMLMRKSEGSLYL